MKFRLTIFTLFAVFLSINLLAQSAKPAMAKEAAWIVVTEPDYQASELDAEADDGYVDILYERQSNPEEKSFYYKTVIKVLTEAGVQNSSEISVNFDPIYQKLFFHTIKIRRENEVLNRLDLAKIKTIQQEKDLHKFLYDGSLTSILFLEDVRTGDIIEYSYTIVGSNPIFKNHFTSIYDLGFAVPIYNLNYRLVTDENRKINIKYFNSTIKAIEAIENNRKVYTWNVKNVKPLRFPEKIPSWYDPYPYVQVSDYQSWKEVNDWALELFPDVNNLAQGLRDKIKQIKNNSNSEEQQVLTALRFVQDEIRYMGIEMGSSSHKPGNPNKIFEQRFGDCKDKSYLLCTILRNLGIEAAPVMINTTYRKLLKEWLPSATAFDHCTVRVKNDGKEYWLDPTISFQRGSLADISYPNYQYGLVLDKATTELAGINRTERGLVKIDEVFDVKDMSGKAQLTVITESTGSYADNARSDFKSTSKYELLKKYKDFYDDFFENIKADSIGYTDDENSGKFISREYYTINDFWGKKLNKQSAWFESFVIKGLINKPKDAQRDFPFALTYPAHYKEKIEINLPVKWDAEESLTTVETSSFRYVADFSYSGKQFVLKYDYESLRPEVDNRKLREHIDAVDKIENELSYELTDNSSNPSSENYTKNNVGSGFNLTNLVIVVLIVIVIGICVWKFR